MPPETPKCPDCRTAEHMRKARRPIREEELVGIVYLGWLAAIATKYDQKQWFRCGRCGVYIRGAGRGMSEILSGLMFGDRGRAGAVWRSPPLPADQRD